MIQRTGADQAPRVVPEALAAEIESEHYFTAAEGVIGAFTAGQAVAGRGVFPDEIGHLRDPLNVLTFCVLVLKNGFTVHGVSACASPANYRREVGERVARENAEREIWPLLGFRLRDKLAAAEAREDLVVAFPSHLFPADSLNMKDSAQVARDKIPAAADFPAGWSLEDALNDYGGSIVVRFTTPGGSPSLPSSWDAIPGLRVVGRGPLGLFKRNT